VGELVPGMRAKLTVTNVRGSEMYWRFGRNYCFLSTSSATQESEMK
jgi:hypothetical protein